MSTTSSSGTSMESENWAKVERIVRDFEKALQSGDNPQIEAYLSVEGDARASLLSELVHAELEYWLKAGKTVRVETYLERFPELRQNARELVALIVSEFRFRQKTEKKLSWREFVTRFPELEDTLQSELAPLQIASAPTVNRAKDETTEQSIVAELTPEQPNGTATTDEPLVRAPSTVEERPSKGRPLDEAPGSLIGPYKLVRKLGEGGMGAVYLAEQEHPVRRQVALKVIRPGLNNAHILARFEAERQSLSMMDHVNIAKVLDVGATEGRQPYFVMEYVQGEPLTRYCEANKLSIPERLELFVMVCQGIQHAHQKGVIHRDIKPSNILVTIYENKPIPKVIDFGLAKATEGALTDEALTAFGTVLGTLDYMSPEQADGNAQGIDTRSDIYSLGVMLYELLTGTPPLDRAKLKNTSFTAILRMIKEEEPPRPSARLSEEGRPLAKIAGQRKTEPAKLVKLLRSELDWITLKALEKDRNRRYDTASGLGLEVQRYLADEPVEACPPSASYRLGKFARKHRALLATTSGIAALLVLGIVGLIVGLVLVTDAHAKETQANEHARKALEDKNTENIAKIFAQDKRILAIKGEADALRIGPAIILRLLPKHGHLTTADQALFVAVLGDFERLASEQGDTAEAREVQAEGEFGMASILVLLGRHAEAEKGYGRAIALYTSLGVELPAEPLYRDSLAKCYNQLGLLYRDLSRFPEAEEELHRSIDLQQKLADDFPSDKKHQARLAEVVIDLGIVLNELGKPEEANTSFDRAIRVVDLLTTKDPANDDNQLVLAKCHVNRGIVFRNLNKLTDAEHSFDQAATLLEPLVKKIPENPDRRLELAKCQIGHAVLFTETGKAPEAKTAYQQAISNYFRVAEQFPLVPDYRSNLARAYSDYGAFLSDDPKETKAADQSYVSAITLGEQLVEQFAAVPEYKIELAAYYGNYANFVRDQNKPAAALEKYGKAIAMLDKLGTGTKSAEVYRIYLNAYWDRALTFEKLDKHTEEKADWRRALDSAEALLKAQEVGQGAAGDNYFVARAYALASVAFKDDAKLPEQYASRALALLKQAKTLGYFQDKRRVEQLNMEKDLDSLRKGSDFKKLVAELGV